MVCSRAFIFSIAAAVLLPTSFGWALPFNDDMVHDQLKVSELMRSAPKETFPVGSLRRYVPDRQAAVELENPVEATKASVLNGERLWDVNCVPCHGRYTGEPDPSYPSVALFEKPIHPTVAGPTTGINLVGKSYIEDPAKTDGHLFGYIYFGGLAIMPRYGYKLSIKEHWDIVNYIRSMQSDFISKLPEEEQEDEEENENGAEE